MITNSFAVFRPNLGAGGAPVFAVAQLDSFYRGGDDRDAIDGDGAVRQTSRRAEFPIEHAIADMRVIDAAFRSARSDG